jgi:hypothetical protein
VYDRIILRIFAAEDDRARVKMERDIVAQKQASRNVLARGQINRPATLMGARVNYLLDGRRIQSLSITRCSM